MYACHKHVFPGFLVFFLGLTFLFRIWCCSERLILCQLSRSDVFRFSLEHLKHQGVAPRAQPSVFRKQSLAGVSMISNMSPGVHRVAQLPVPKLPADVFDCCCFRCSYGSELLFPSAALSPSNPPPSLSFSPPMSPSDSWSGVFGQCGFHCSRPLSLLVRPSFCICLFSAFFFFFSIPQELGLAVISLWFSLTLSMHSMLCLSLAVPLYLVGVSVSFSLQAPWSKISSGQNSSAAGPCHSAAFYFLTQRYWLHFFLDWILMSSPLVTATKGMEGETHSK